MQETKDQICHSTDAISLTGLRFANSINNYDLNNPINGQECGEREDDDFDESVILSRGADEVSMQESSEYQPAAKFAPPAKNQKINDCLPSKSSNSQDKMAKCSSGAAPQLKNVQKGDPNYGRIQNARKRKFSDLVEEEPSPEELNLAKRNFKNLEKQYKKMQSEMKKIKDNFRKQEKAVNAFLEYQLHSAINETSTSHRQPKESKEHRVCSECYHQPILSKKPSSQEGMSSGMVMSEIESQEQTKKGAHESAFESGVSYYSKQTETQFNKNKLPLSQLKKTVEISKTSAKNKKIYYELPSDLFDIPEAILEDFPSAPPQDRDLELMVRTFVSKFEQGDFDSVDINSLKIEQNSDSQIRLTFSNTQNNTNLLIWTQQGYFYMGGSASGQPEGVGIQFQIGEYKYRGQFKAGNKEGKGRCRYIDGKEYYGQWKADMKEGKGEQTDQFGTFYQGTWANDLKQGKGKLTTIKGCTYQGQFHLGFKHGYGIWTDKTGQMYKGYYQRDLKHGQGEYYSNQKLVYKGEFKCGFKLSLSKSKGKDKTYSTIDNPLRSYLENPSRMTRRDLTNNSYSNNSNSMLSTNHNDRNSSSMTSSKNKKHLSINKQRLAKHSLPKLQNKSMKSSSMLVGGSKLKAADPEPLLEVLELYSNSVVPRSFRTINWRKS